MMGKDAAGKGQRVAGVFFVMLGGGLLLETKYAVVAASIALLGLTLMLLGLKRALEGDVKPAIEREEDIRG